LGRSSRPIPVGLPDKLLYVRLLLRLTQKQMFDRLQSGLDPILDDQIKLHSSHISEYERGIREPPLRVLLEYARIAQVPMEVLVDRFLSLPSTLRASLMANNLKKAGPRVYWPRVRRAQAEYEQEIERHNENKTKSRKKVRTRSENKPK
jgi:transcriptional regulator with XRE-family HTH domain